MIVFAASVLIAYLDSDDEHHTTAKELLARAVDDDFGADSLTLAEVLGVPVRDDRQEQVLAALRDLEVNELSFPPDTACRLARLRANTGLKMPDCCVLLAAEGVGATAIATFDDRLAQTAEDRSLLVLRS